MMRDRAAREVKRAAMKIIIIPTGMLVFRPVKAEIHPLKTRKLCINPQQKKNPATQQNQFTTSCLEAVKLRIT